MKLADSGERTTFSTGAQRELTEQKGRCDLIYNKVVSELVNDDMYAKLEDFVRTGNRTIILTCIRKFVTENYNCWEDAYLELAKHYENGAKKYSDRNFEKGIPYHCYVDSALKHYTKFKRGDTDEPHDSAFLWNLVALLYTMDNKPDCNDLPKGE